MDLATTPFTVGDSGCGLGAETATSGTVTFTEADAAGVAGSFDLVFVGADHVTGTFHAPVCTPTDVDASPHPCN